MFTKWTQHLKDPIEKQRFVNEILSSKSILDHLGVILESMEKTLERSERSPKAYDAPNWQYRQAHCNGYLQCLYEIKAFVNLDQQEIVNDRNLTK